MKGLWILLPAITVAAASACVPRADRFNPNRPEYPSGWPDRVLIGRGECVPVAGIYRGTGENNIDYEDLGVQYPSDLTAVMFGNDRGTLDRPATEGDVCIDCHVALDQRADEYVQLAQPSPAVLEVTVIGEKTARDLSARYSVADGTLRCTADGLKFRTDHDYHPRGCNPASVTLTKSSDGDLLVRYKSINTIYRFSGMANEMVYRCPTHWMKFRPATPHNAAER